MRLSKMFVVLVFVLLLASLAYAFVIPAAKSYGGAIRNVDFSYSRSFAGKSVEFANVCPDGCHKVEEKYLDVFKTKGREVQNFGEGLYCWCPEN